MVSEISGKRVNNNRIDHLEKFCPFTNFQDGFKSSDQLQIFWQLYLIEFMEALIGLGLPML